eukprot:532317_1
MGDFTSEPGPVDRQWVNTEPGHEGKVAQGFDAFRQAASLVKVVEDAEKIGGSIYPLFEAAEKTIEANASTDAPSDPTEVDETVSGDESAASSNSYGWTTIALMVGLLYLAA